VGLLDELDADPRGRRGSRCAVEGALLLLDDDDRADLVAALAATDAAGFRYSSKRITDALARRDVELSEWSIQRHHRGGCACDRTR